MVYVGFYCEVFVLLKFGVLVLSFGVFGEIGGDLLFFCISNIR